MELETSHHLRRSPSQIGPAAIEEFVAYVLLAECGHTTSLCNRRRAADPRLLETQMEDELDNVLKVNVCHLYPLGNPDGVTRLCYGLHRGDALDLELGFHGFLDKEYPLEPPARLLQNCKHLLDCVYVVVCGHTLLYPDLAPDPTSAKLDSIPSASRLLVIGISVTDRAPTLDMIGLRGCGYVTSARLSLPKVDVYDFTEMVFHNLAVHEQLVDGGRYGELRCFLEYIASLSNDAVDGLKGCDHVQQHSMVMAGLTKVKDFIIWGESGGFYQNTSTVDHGVGRLHLSSIHFVVCYCHPSRQHE